MTLGSPLRALSGNCLALALASALLIPSIILFCAVHKAAVNPLHAGIMIVHVCAVKDTVREDAHTSKSSCDATYTSLVQEQAEQNALAVAQNVEQQLWPDFGAYNDTYDGMAAFWGEDIVSNLCSNIGQLMWKWCDEMPMEAGLIVCTFLILWIAPPVILSKL
jgi:hypothetical protein